jgi:S1-C subfamily serine protease
LAEGAPADRAKLQVGDIVLEVADAPVAGLADLFRRIWALGPAGTVIPLTVARGGEELSIPVHSADRSDFLKAPELQ